MPPAPPDPFHPDRFLDAQEVCYAAVLDELRRGRKTVTEHPNPATTEHLKSGHGT
jgi:uncharacterized protein (DUF1810 family)